jgi:electron transfer flavoprotein beta subunit
MKIVVCVKHVPDSTSQRGFDPSDWTVDRAGVDGLLSELDEYAVEEALRIAGGDGEVVVLTMGPAQAADAVRRALQMGAGSGVHVLDDAVHGSDALATSLVLATALQRIGDYDLVLCGMASTDGAMGVMAAMLAERLGMPQLSFATEVSVAGDLVTVRRDADLAMETVEARMPVVLSVTDQINEPRYPSFKLIMAAKKKPVQTWSLSDLDLDVELVGLSAARTAVRAVEPRPARTAGTVVTDDGQGGARLVEFLAGQRLV